MFAFDWAIRSIRAPIIGSDKGKAWKVGCYDLKGEFSPCCKAGSYRSCFRGSRGFNCWGDKGLLSVFWSCSAQRWLGPVYQGCWAELPWVALSEHAPDHLFSLTPCRGTGDIMTCGLVSGKIPPVHRRRGRTAVASSKRRAGKQRVGKENKWKRERKEAVSEGLAGVVVLLCHHGPDCLNRHGWIWRGLRLWLWGYALLAFSPVPDYPDAFPCHFRNQLLLYLSYSCVTPVSSVSCDLDARQIDMWSDVQFKGLFFQKLSIQTGSSCSRLMAYFFSSVQPKNIIYKCFMYNNFEVWFFFFFFYVSWCLILTQAIPIMQFFFFFKKYFLICWFGCSRISYQC